MGHHKVGAFVTNKIREFAYVRRSNSGKYSSCKEKKPLRRMKIFLKKNHEYGNCYKVRNVNLRVTHS